VVEYTLEVLSEGGAAGVGVGDCGRDEQDREDCKKMRRAASHEMERNVGSKSKRNDSAPHMGLREYIAASGCLYYHHKATKTTQWKKPFYNAFAYSLSTYFLAIHSHSLL